MSISPKISISLRIPKDGNSIEECEDQFHYSSDYKNIAMADGATEASYSKEWAEMLLKSYCDKELNNIDSENYNQWIDLALQRWRIYESNIQSNVVPWFTLDKLIRGSAAAFIGITFASVDSTGNHLLWNAVAYGDVCFFIVQDNRLRLSYPIETSNAFSNSPPLLQTSIPYKPEKLLKIPGSFSYNDKCFIMTDSLSEWFLKTYERGESPWLLLSSFTEVTEFEKFINQERSTRAIKNDDVTLLIVEFVDDENHE